MPLTATQQLQLINETFSDSRFSNKQGEYAVAHWIAYNDLCTIAEISDNDKVNLFKITLLGEPRIWFNDNKDSFTDIATLERAFKNTYGKIVSREEYLKQFRNASMKEGEDISQFRNRVRTLAAKAKITDPELVLFTFIDGMPAHIRPALRAIKDKSIDECMLTARALLSEQPASSVSQIFAATQQNPTANVSNDLADRMENLLLTYQKSHHHDHDHPRKSNHDSYADHRQSRSRYSDRHTTRRSSRSYSRGRSYHRHGDSSFSRQNSRSHSRGRVSDKSPSYNHYDHQRRSPSQSRDRRSRSRDTTVDRKVSFQRSQSPIICDVCKTPGHPWRQCRKLQKAIASNNFKIEQNF
jgi:hypothetical protein